jgi:hypothetical protein
MQLLRKLPERAPNCGEVPTEFVGTITRIQTALRMRAVPLGRHRPEMHIQHLSDFAGEDHAARILFHRVAGVAEYLPQAFESARLHARLVGQRLNCYPRPQFHQEVVGRALIRRKFARRILFGHGMSSRIDCAKIFRRVQRPSETVWDLKEALTGINISWH